MNKGILGWLYKTQEIIGYFCPFYYIRYNGIEEIFPFATLTSLYARCTILFVVFVSFENDSSHGKFTRISIWLSMT